MVPVLDRVTAPVAQLLLLLVEDPSALLLPRTLTPELAAPVTILAVPRLNPAIPMEKVPVVVIVAPVWLAVPFATLMVPARPTVPMLTACVPKGSIMLELPALTAMIPAAKLALALPVVMEARFETFTAPPGAMLQVFAQLTPNVPATLLARTPIALPVGRLMAAPALILTATGPAPPLLGGKPVILES
jgi:hypothetical protein